ncbi:cytochrome b [Halopseudomonas maritima]|uniref:cytochrome b n=1 Tax=Halopseudomonas maritima TaxID=2918528 RepID=UPI001EEB471D|nr:cytochrome b [Halopseudomonas maritima]UJJ30358.1 cytochrome b [Halopseudomonas maritima]
MQWRNSNDRFGWITGSLHWLMALLVIGLTALGLWMTSLTYYSPYYTSAPFWHKSLGLVFAALLLLRLIWRAATPFPEHLTTHQRWERQLATAAQWLMYAAMLLIVVSGYLISTAKGRGVSLFGWFEVPALVSNLPGQAQRAGALHYWLALGLLGVAGIHALGALKHHVLDKDNTLRRMLGMRLLNATEKGK